MRNGVVADYPPLLRSVSCEIAIVGGGITGAFLAQTLVEAGREVVVLDQRSIGEGSTAASTALLQYEVDTPLYRLERLIGAASAERVYQLGAEALRSIAARVRRLRIDCDFAPRLSLQLASRRRDLPGLQRESERRAAIGLRTQVLFREALRRRHGFDHAGALLTRDAAEVDPIRLTHGLLSAAIRQGARVHDRVAVTKVRPTPRGVRLETDVGATVRAARVIFATGYETAPWTPRCRTRIVGTYALVTDPVPPIDRWRDRCLIWETARPYVYLRRTSDDRILIGGGDVAKRSAAVRNRLIEVKTEWLSRRLRRLFPRLRCDVARAWSGAFAESADTLPYIGPSPDHKRLFFSLGYGGNGITFAQIGASLLHSLLVDGIHQDAELFRFGREQRA